MRVILDNISFRDCWLLSIICGSGRSEQRKILTSVLDNIRIVEQGRVACSMKDRSNKGVGEGDNDRLEDSEPLSSARHPGGALARKTTLNGRGFGSSVDFTGPAVDWTEFQQAGNGVLLVTKPRVVTNANVPVRKIPNSDESLPRLPSYELPPTNALIHELVGVKLLPASAEFSLPRSLSEGMSHQLDGHGC